jgi:hypothetical protein
LTRIPADPVVEAHAAKLSTYLSEDGIFGILSRARVMVTEAKTSLGDHTESASFRTSCRLEEGFSSRIG